MTTYWDRFIYFVNVTNPSTLFLKNEEILKAKQIVLNNNNEKNSTNVTTSNKEIQKYSNIVNATIHPVTGEIIYFLFRMSAIAPVNIPLVFAMLSTPSSNIPATLFLHWLNQSYNTACNYANRSGSKNQSIKDIFLPYSLAVTSACGFAFGLGFIYLLIFVCFMIILNNWIFVNNEILFICEVLLDEKFGN
jgi:hypothetical protein